MAATNVQAFPGDVTISSNLAVDTNTLFVDSVGNRVGIGTNVPESLLHLSASTASADITDPIKLKIHNRKLAADWSITQPWGLLEFDTDDVGTAGSGPVAGIGCRFETSSGGDSSICFYTDAATGNDTVLGAANERMCIDSDGLVGIGTSNPNTKLEIQATTPVIRLTDNRTNTATSGLELGAIEWYSRESSLANDYGPVAKIAVHVGNTTTAPDGNIRFSTGINGTLTEKMILDYNGTLSITGDIVQNRYVETGSRNATATTNSSGNVSINMGQLYRGDNSGVAASVTYSPADGTVNCTGFFKFTQTKVRGTNIVMGAVTDFYSRDSSTVTLSLSGADTVVNIANGYSNKSYIAVLHFVNTANYQV